MRKGSGKALKSPHSRNSLSQRCLRVEHLESRSLLSAAPWTPEALGPEMLPRENLDILDSTDLVPYLAAPLQAGYNMPTEPIALNSLPDMQPPTSESHLSPPPEPEPFRNAMQSAPRTHQPEGGLAAVQMAPFNIAPPIDSGRPTQPTPPSILEHGHSGLPMREAQEVLGADWAGISGNLTALPPALGDILPLPPPSIAPHAFGRMGVETAEAPFSAIEPGEFGEAPWDGGRAYMPPFGRGDLFSALGGSRVGPPPLPEHHDPFAARGFSETLAGIGVMDSLVATVSGGTTGSISLANGWYAASESFPHLSADLDQGGLVALSNGQNTGARSEVTESPYDGNRSYSLTTRWSESPHFSTVAAMDSDLGAPLRTLSAFQESVTSLLDDQNGGLIDIDAATGPSTSRDRSPSWESRQRFSIETLLGRNDWVANDEELPDKEGRHNQAGALADAALTSDWDANSEEGGMIELAVADPHEVHSQAPVASPSESGTSPWREIRIDKGLGRFRVLEVAEATSEQQGDRVLAQQATDEDLPTASTNTAEGTTPEASASAATEPHVEADRHAAAAPAIVGLSLVSGSNREKSEKSIADDSHKSRNRKCRTV